MTLTIFAIILFSPIYAVLSYRWLENLRQRIEGFYIGKDYGLKAPESERYIFHINNQYLLVFWLSSLPLGCIPILCLEAGLVLERRRTARLITFAVNNLHELDSNPERRKVFVSLPGPSKFKYSEEPSHMIFPQTNAGGSLLGTGEPWCDRMTGGSPRRAPKPIPSPTVSNGRSGQKITNGLQPGDPYSNGR